MPWRVQRPIVIGGLAGVAVAGVVCGTAALCGRPVLEKAAVQLLMPAGVVWLLLTSIVAVSLAERRRGVSMFAVSAWVLSLVSGNGIVASQMIRSLEDGYYEARPLTTPPVDTLVLLGGGVGEAPGDVAQLNANGDRIVLAARLYHSGKVQQIICTGQRTEEVSVLGRDEANLSKQILTGLGIPSERIATSGGRNTSEEMAALSQLEALGERIGLVTSAWHMDRAVRLAHANQLDVVPLPADFQSKPSTPDRPVGAWFLACIPQASHMHANGRALREYLARLFGR